MFKSPTPRPADGGVGGSGVLRAQSSGRFTPNTGPGLLVENEVLIIMQIRVYFGFGPFTLRCLWSVSQNSVRHGKNGMVGLLSP